jgi:hypothetical protein
MKKPDRARARAFISGRAGPNLGNAGFPALAPGAKNVFHVIEALYFLYVSKGSQALQDFHLDAL